MSSKRIEPTTPIEPQNILGPIKSITKTDIDYLIQYKTGEQSKLTILNNHVFRFYMSPSGEFLDYPRPNNPSENAKINSKSVQDYDTKSFKDSTLDDKETEYFINTDKIQINLDKNKSTMTVLDKRTNKVVLNEVEPLAYKSEETTQELFQHEDEYYFGGGMQNGRFSHKGEIIKIENSFDWDDGGVSSPCPFYWSSKGYGILTNTWKCGTLNFKSEKSVTISHETVQFDAFYFINIDPKGILCDYYELTGAPLFMPEYAFYEAHLNEFNRDYWVKVDPKTARARLFEDGFYYKKVKPTEDEHAQGIIESLNGEKNNYQFSARAMVDRYTKHDMPLGWFVPNDGYGAGYGQTDTLDGDIENLKQFANYAHSKGVQVGVWTESNLEPKDPSNPVKGDRDLHKEISKAGVVALKADVAWIGDGYSTGLSAIEKAYNIFTEAAKGKVRPMVIMVCGWAGTQRYSALWSGDQRGGVWEYIRFHIPTYIGTGLSGQPIVGSDMDGIYDGKEKNVNIRDYQWKSFTPLQLNMDGWGLLPKTPFAFDEEATKINRAYLKIKSMLMPYNYTIAHESIKGLPMVRAMFLEFFNDITAYTKYVQYQYMWGPYLLVAPIYNEIEDNEGNSLRNDLYLPDRKQIWIDFFTGKKYQGGRVLNNMAFPLWKLPVFVKDGAIIPLVNSNNNPSEILRNERIFNIYPNGQSSFECYEDDGISCGYKNGESATTQIEVIAPNFNSKGDLIITISPTKGQYETMVPERKTIFQIMSSQDIKSIKVALNDKNVILTKALDKDKYDSLVNVYYFDTEFKVNKYLDDVVDSVAVNQNFLLLKLETVDVTKTVIQIKISDFDTASSDQKALLLPMSQEIDKNLAIPAGLAIADRYTSAEQITLNWKTVEDIEFYEIERDDLLFTNIDKAANSFLFENLRQATKYKFRIRTGNVNRVSHWSDYVYGKTDKVQYKEDLVPFETI